ncbi:MAG TPA: CHAT domain-containing protein [Actinomycetota bacterium]|nr:CHAT domain-containing protein [Actinomycetota bacterium]
MSGAGDAQELGYLDFDVLLERAGAGAYQARVLNAPAGLPAPAPFSLPLSPLEVENFLLRVGRPRHGTARRIDSPESAAVKAFGGQLFAALFHDDLHESLLRSLGEAEHQQRGLRIRLRLSECPELAELPWEFLYDQQRNRFLSLSRRTPLVRYLALPDPPRSLAVSPPLRVLVMIASPNGYPELDVEQEWGKLKEALGGLEQAGRVELERLELATLAALHHRLRGDDAYHIFHFIGHGGFDPQRQDGVLLFEDEQGREFAVTGEKLGTLLNDHGPMRLVVLNACEGARGDATDPFAGTAQSLMQQGLPAVVAMQFEITDEAAIIFAHELYAAVADGLPLDAALSEARRAIFFTGNAVEWGTPVLYMRAPDGRIFELDRGSATEPRPRLRVSPTEVDLGELTCGTVAPARIVQLHNVGGGQLNARVETSEPWIQVRKLDDRVQLRVDTAVVGSLDGEVRVRSDGGDASVRVRAQVQPGPTLAVEPRLVDFGRLAVGAHPEVLVRVGNTGRGELEWSHRSSGSFFRTERVPEGLRLRLDAGTPGRHQGSISVGSNGGDVVLQVLAELVGAQPVGAEPGPRRPRRFGLLAAGLALLLLGGLAVWGLLRPGPPAPAPAPTPTAPKPTTPENLADAVADFGTAFTPTGFEGPFTLDSLGRFFGADTARIRPVLKRLGLRRGFARSLASAEDERLGVLVMELGSAAAARAAGPQIGVCRDPSKGDFEVPSIAGATGRRCQDGDGDPVQEVVFARGPLLYKMKLERIREPRSTSRIVEMARLQARKASP